MRKMVVLLALVVSFSWIGYTPTLAAVNYNQRPVEINVNGEFIPLDVHPTLENNRLFIPIRSLASLGIHYSFSSNVVTLKNQNGEYLKITVGSKVAYKGNQKIQMDQPAKNENGRVLVPIRFVSEALGYQVEYEALRQMVFVKSESYHVDMNQITQEDLQAARKAAISLPIKFNFQPLDSSGAYHEYSFPVGRADTYMLLDSHNTTLVKIENGTATAIGQFDDSDRSKTSGAIPPHFIFDTDPLFEAYNNSNVLFMDNRNGTAKAIYGDENGKRIEIMTKLHVYSDIIQNLPK